MDDVTRGDAVLTGNDLLAIRDRLDDEQRKRGDQAISKLASIPIVQVDDGVLEPLEYRLVFGMELGQLKQIEVAGEIGYNLFKHRVRDAIRRAG